MELKLSIGILLNDNVVIKEGNKVELSLGCHICERIDRTFIFQPLKNPVCRKVGHEVDGSLTFKGKTFSKPDQTFTLSDTAQLATLEYDISFDHHDFVDKENQIPSRPKTNWGRVFFSLICPHCNHESQVSTQTNLMRNVEFKCEECDHLLALDTREQPVYTYK